VGDRTGSPGPSWSLQTVNVPTAEEARVRFWEAFGAIQAAAATAGDPFGRGTCPCPRCGTGTVTYDFSILTFGTGQCSTPRCLRWDSPRA
jgi:hypothetical protein